MSSPAGVRSGTTTLWSLLPLALALGTVAGLGSYYETSDDATLAWLFSGVLARQPVSSRPIPVRGSR